MDGAASPHRERANQPIQIGANSSFTSAGEIALLVCEAGRLPSACFQTDHVLARTRGGVAGRVVLEIPVLVRGHQTAHEPLA